MNRMRFRSRAGHRASLHRPAQRPRQSSGCKHRPYLNRHNWKTTENGDEYDDEDENLILPIVLVPLLVLVLEN
jgi:hypothetical protein